MEKKSTAELKKSRCVPCEGGVDPMTVDQARSQLEELPHWKLVEDGKRIRRRWMAKNFVQAIRFFDRVAEIAEDDGHHPDLHLTSYREVVVELWTHAIGGLSENDFIVAAKIEGLAEEALGS